MGKIRLLILGLLLALLTGVVFMAGCIAPTGTEGETSIWTMVIPLVLIVAVFYFLIIRPQRKKQKEHEKLIEELKRGDRVITAGGIYGIIENTSEDSIVIKIESGATMRVDRNSVTIKREK